MSGASAKTVLLATGLNKASLKKIWDLSDVSKDGKLDQVCVREVIPPLLNKTCYVLLVLNPPLPI